MYPLVRAVYGYLIPEDDRGLITLLKNKEQIDMLAYRGENSVGSLGFGSVGSQTAPWVLPKAGTETVHDISETEKTALNPPQAVVDSVWFLQQRRSETGTTGDRLEEGPVSHRDRRA
ncbi:hypothetical protein TIFTF001_028061 [Ficus carica]|uniref:Uncharacterized protein n=1 Tax=Ficus carica TaxID=3494 RepID=A0AA88DPD5_FICCA|nr:hypothetical protein TIFTF001_028061 [Ficus carica]